MFAGPVVTQDDVNELFDKEGAWQETTMDDILASRAIKRNPYHPVPRGYSLFHAFEIMARTGAHRVPVVDRNDRVANIITQSMLIKFFHSNMALLGKLAKTTVYSMLEKIPPSTIITINASSTARQGFAKISKQVVSGIAVVDDKTGYLVDSLSARDLRGIGTDASSFWRLWETITTYKENCRKSFPELTPKKVVSIVGTDTLDKVLGLMMKHRVHRLFIVESKKTPTPTRVLTMTDILRVILGAATKLHWNT
eukprot:TRINITY_DN4985_c0_g1_i7.p1 TRINITY_DN4985_c0_g1~~TRINITY_DN4985_c0_g1_i7.p1  ORF type:complete len:253 (-),score=24.37 TRINITY_DN4985_c0_g1_i7:304-1062(-)